MNKIAVRRLKSNFSLRWHTFKHNRKNPNKILLLEEKFVIKNIVPGSVLCMDGLEEMYRDILLLSNDNQSMVNNIVVINPVETKYCTPVQIADFVKHATARLAQSGRLIFDVKLMFVIYDRLNTSLEDLCADIVSNIESLGFGLVNKSLRLRPTPGYGNLFLSFDRV